MRLTRTKSTLIPLSLCVLMSLSACQTNDFDSTFSGAKESATGYKTRANKRMLSIAEQAIADDRAEEALMFYEKLYLRDPKNPEIALNYAQVLRKTDHAQHAVMVLSAFITPTEGQKKAPKPTAGMLSEFASSNLELGHFTKTIEIAQQLLNASKAKLYHPQAYNLLGLAFDAQGAHKDAENAFRQAMDIWPGTPIIVMNNLALSLANQGLFDEALTTLRQARVLSPDRQEIARNIEIITDLKKAVVKKAL